MRAFVHPANCAPFNGQHGRLEDGTDVYVFTLRDGRHVATSRACRVDRNNVIHAQAIAPGYLGCAPPGQRWQTSHTAEVVLLSAVEQMPLEMITAVFAAADRLERCHAFADWT